MTLRIALIASLFSFGCAKDEDSGGAAVNACDALVASYCACDAITDDMCAAYEEDMNGSTGSEAACEANQTAFDAAGGCDQYAIPE